MFRHFDGNSNFRSDMVEQTLINIVGGIILFGVSFMAQRTWSALNELEHRDQQLGDKINHIEVMVAKSYITREETEKLFERVFLKLDRIEEKISGKRD